MKRHVVNSIVLCLAILILTAGCGPAATPLPPTMTATAPPTSTPVPTDTPVPTATLRPTATPRPTATMRPTNTPQPTIDVPNGFKPLEGDGITLWLPESFEGGSMTGKDREILLKAMSNLGGVYNDMVEQFKDSGTAFLFYGYDTVLGERGNLTNVNVVEIPMMSRMTPLTAAEILAQQFPKQLPGVKVLSTEAVSLPRYDAARLTLALTLKQAKLKEAFYLVHANGKFYAVTFAAGVEEFDELLPVFEQSIQTFTVKP